MTLNPLSWIMWLAWRPAHGIVRALPLTVSYRWAEWMAVVFNGFPTAIRRQVRREIKRIFPLKNEKEVKSIARRSFVMFAKRQIENVILGSMDAQQVLRLTSLTGEDRLKSALARGKGVIILLSHFGSFLMILPALLHRGYVINQLAGPPEISNHMQNKLFNLRKKESDKMPVRFLRTDQSMRQVVRALNNNELLAIAFDGRESEQWVNIDFLNQPASIAAGFLRLADMTGAAIVPTFIVRQADNTHQIIFEEPFIASKHQDRESYYQRTIQEMAKCFEEYIHRYPCHFGVTLARLNASPENNKMNVPLFRETEDTRMRKT